MISNGTRYIITRDLLAEKPREGKCSLRAVCGYGPVIFLHYSSLSPANFQATTRTHGFSLRIIPSPFPTLCPHLASAPLPFAMKRSASFSSQRLPQRVCQSSVQPPRRFLLPSTYRSSRAPFPSWLPQHLITQTHTLQLPIEPTLHPPASAQNTLCLLLRLSEVSDACRNIISSGRTSQHPVNPLCACMSDSSAFVSFMSMRPFRASDNLFLNLNLASEHWF